MSLPKRSDSSRCSWRAQPVDVAAQGVDLTVVDDIPVGMSQLPAREGVGAEPRMDQRQGRLQVRLGQVAKIAFQLVGDEHPFVDQRPVRQAGDVEELAAFERAAVADFVLRALADDVQLALESHVVGDGRIAGDEDHPHLGLGPSGRPAERSVVDLDRPPPDDALPFGGDDLLEVDLDRAPVVDVRRQEDHPDAVVAGPRQAVAVAVRLPAQEGVRHLDQDSRAVSGVGLGPARSPVSQVGEDGQRLANDLVRPLPADIHHQPEAAGVVLEAGIVQALPARRPRVVLTGFRLRLTHGCSYATSPASTSSSAFRSAPPAAPRTVLCPSRTIFQSSTGQGRTRPTVTAIPSPAATSRRGCGRSRSSVS